MITKYLPDPLEVGYDINNFKGEKSSSYKMFFVHAGNFGDEVAERLEFPDDPEEWYSLGADYEDLQIDYTKIEADTESPLEKVVTEVMNFAEKIKKGLDNKAPTALEDAQYLGRWADRVRRAREGEYDEPIDY
ncbi:hypothetical protein HYU08_00780 [Candidatus Woesearchaeota archaeon]|nr:hypothetical protein [Candidatus Woesearchaeota archaeon]